MTGYVQPFLSRIARTGLIFGLILLSFLWSPASAGAETSPCGISQTTGAGYFFTSFESIDRTASGLPIEHFKIDEGYADGRSLNLSVNFFNEECDPSDTNTYSKNITLPAGVIGWSVRFTTPTHLDVWDDVHETIFASLDLPAVPAYSKVSLRASIDGGASTLQTPTLLLVAGAVPPQHVGTLPLPSDCSSLSSQGYLFDGSYEHSEYVNGLLRVHLRLSSPYNDGREFRSIGVSHDGDCNAAVPSIFSYKGTVISPFVRYYSFRMTSATHYELWNDESEIKLICDGCSGDFEQNSPYVSWQATIDGNASFVATTPFSPTKQEECCSSVFFLPGFQSSRLYTPGFVSENQLWEPNVTLNQGDIKKLGLNSLGQSINTVYTKKDDVIGNIHVPFMVDIDIYQTFLEQLNQFEEEDKIDGYNAFAYDWRLSPEGIVENGTLYDDGIHLPSVELEKLAASSTTGKVTIVAHSNGGLVAKALIQRLEREGKSNLIDKLILVATPQLGTPKTIASMLHGDFQNKPFLISKANARSLSENMPGAYALLPSSAYLAKVTDPIINLAAAPRLKFDSGLSVTDGKIKDFNTFSKFISSVGIRQKPAADNIETPNILSSLLLSHSVAVHDSLDTWVPPSNILVTQIAGWGLDTPSGITYVEKSKVTCKNSICSNTVQLSHIVNMTEDGDRTVVTPSAITNPFWSTYYIDLYKNYKDSGLYNEHMNITETPSFQQLFTDLISSTTVSILPKNVHQINPGNNGSKKLRIRMLSPVDIDAYDNQGRHTGLLEGLTHNTDLIIKEENIPNSYYEEFGEGKYIGLPGDGIYHIDLKGLDHGTFTFEVSTVENGQVSETISYQNIPVTASSTGSFVISDGDLDQSSISLDINGDGIKELNNATSSLVRDPLIYIKLVKSTIQTMDLGTKTKQQLLSKFSNIERLISKSDKWDDEDDDGRELNLKKGEKLIERIIKKIDKTSSYLQKQLEKSMKKPQKDEKITAFQAEVLLNTLVDLKTLVQ